MVVSSLAAALAADACHFANAAASLALVWSVSRRLELGTPPNCNGCGFSKCGGGAAIVSTSLCFFAFLGGAITLGRASFLCFALGGVCLRSFFVGGIPMPMNDQCLLQFLAGGKSLCFCFVELSRDRGAEHWLLVEGAAVSFS